MTNKTWAKIFLLQISLKIYLLYNYKHQYFMYQPWSVTRSLDGWAEFQASLSSRLASLFFFLSFFYLLGNVNVCTVYIVHTRIDVFIQDSDSTDFPGILTDFCQSGNNGKCQPGKKFNISLERTQECQTESEQDIEKRF